MCVSLGFVGFSSPLLIEFCSQSKILSKRERMCEDLFAVYLGPQLSLEEARLSSPNFLLPLIQNITPRPVDDIYKHTCGSSCMPVCRVRLLRSPA